MRAWLTAALMIAVASTSAFAQGGATGSITGVVVDTSGSVIPGATVEAVNVATNAVSATVSSAEGTFTIPSLNAGTYNVTVTLQGFKTFKAEKLELGPGTQRSVRATLEVGGLEETIVVTGGTELMQTSSPTVSRTMNANQIGKLPLVSRNALDAITFMPGFNTPAGNRDTTVNGLPQGAINITLDGMSVQDNYLKTSDGFFARLSPRLDAVEAVTVTTAAGGAESAGQGAVQIRFVTRSGTNNYTGSGYFYLRHDGLNSNTWFNNRDLAPDPATGKAPKSELRQYQPGARLGGPIWIPGVYDGRNKAFFFVNYEVFRQPSKITRNRTILSADAMNGIFRYQGGPAAGVNLLRAGTQGIDPTVASVLSAIRSASGQGTITDLTDPNLQRATFQLTSKSNNEYPTVRVDYNLSAKHRLTGSFNYQHISSNPDTTNSREPVFPGFSHTGTQQSTRWTTSESLRSTLSANIVNEFRIGKTGGATFFSPELNPGMWGTGATPDQGGFHLNIGAAGISNAASTTAQSSREASTINAENTLTWVKGAHSLNFGGAWTQVDLWLQNQTLVPTINFGIATGDPAANFFTTANFPGASNTNLNNARAMYAVLTGRVTQITGNVRLNEKTNKYEYLGSGMQRARMRELGFWAQDQWRWKPNFTVNFGIRYELQLPFYPLNNSYLTATMEDVCGISGVTPSGSCNLFQPGVTGGKTPEFVRFSKNQRAFATDWNNWAPNLGFAWTPHVEGGFLRPLLGSAEGDTVLKAGYSIAYNRGGMSDFSDVFGSNPGVAIATNRDAGLGNLVMDNLGLPVLFSQRGRLGPPPFAEELTLPFRATQTSSVNIMDPNLEVPYAQTWTAGVQRKLTRDTAIEVRYVGTRSLHGWTTYNYNEINIVENNFLNEFRQAQANLAANIAAGRGNTFAFTGAPGTAPLPIFLAHYNGRPQSQAGNPANYTGTNWTNATFLGFLAARNPQPYSFASTNSTNGLLGNATFRNNSITAGLPRNFWVVNPDLLGGANVEGNGGYTKYNSMQVDFRKRLSGGLQMDANYTWGYGYESNRFSFRYPREKRADVGTPGNIVHAFKTNWVYELPFGRGRRWVNNTNALLERIVGGWEFDGTGRIASGRLVNLGNVRLVGMTESDVRKMFKLRFDDAGKVIYMLPQDVIDNTIKAFSVSATTASGYGPQGPPEGRYFAPANGPDCIEIAGSRGDCGTGDLVVSGQPRVRFDLSAVKRVDLRGRMNAEFRAEMLNAFNTPYFTPVAGIGSNPDSYRVTAAESGRVIQLVWRLNF
ncbi:MAG TPA: carboxypeptidase regulatory-like domain-containing protein [Vicinamibacterales bacterium]|nr:carboxypeptidase regulatory-like domain-containing protein [Vicinamibacterales bacterium]